MKGRVQISSPQGILKSWSFEINDRISLQTNAESIGIGIGYAIEDVLFKTGLKEPLKIEVDFEK